MRIIPLGQDYSSHDRPGARAKPWSKDTLVHTPKVQDSPSLRQALDQGEITLSGYDKPSGRGAMVAETYLSFENQAKREAIQAQLGVDIYV